MTTLVPPGPKNALRAGILPNNMSGQLDCYTRLFREYGDYVKVEAMPGFSYYLIFDPSGIEHILQTNQLKYRRSDKVRNVVGLMAGKGLLTSEGDSWLRQRRLAQPSFHREALVSLSNVMSAAIQSFIAEWDAQPNGAEVDLSVEMTRLTLKIVGMALFSIDISDRANIIGDSLIRVNNHTGRMLNLPFAVSSVIAAKNEAFQEALASLDRVVLEVVNARRKSLSDGGDLLSMLIAAKDDDTGESMTDEQLRDEVITLMVAGHDTVASALTWCWILLNDNPDKRDILNSELRSIKTTPPQWLDVQSRPYVKQVFDEALRLYPPAWGIPREAKVNDVVGGFEIEKDQMILLCTFLVHRDSRWWTDPDNFIPERFADDRSSQRPKYAYFPFGGGSRMCIGTHFASMAATLAIAAIAQRYDIDVLGNKPIEMDLSFLLKPKAPVNCKLTRTSD